MSIECAAHKIKESMQTNGLFLLSFLAVLAATGLVVRFCHVFDHWVHDHDLSGVQKLHTEPIPRVGGIPIVLWIVLLECILSVISPTAETRLAWQLLVAAIPVFGAGLVEDLTKRVTPRERLLAAFLSAGIAAFWFGAVLTRLDLPLVDTLLQDHLWLAVAFTCFAVGGMAHAYNLVDGLNGLSSGIMTVSLLALSFVAWRVEDVVLLELCLITLGSVLGFALWNFPRAKIFLGDAGAYFLGFWIAEISVLLVVRNESVSPWFPVIATGYPIIETLFSIFRRKFLLRAKIGMPDNEHLHQLVYRRQMKKLALDPSRPGLRSEEVRRRAHVRSSPRLWLVAGCMSFLGAGFWSSSSMLMLMFALATGIYILVYLRTFRKLKLKFRR